MKTKAAINKLSAFALRQLYHAEELIYNNLGVMADQAFSPTLKDALKNHQEETREQMRRIKEIASFYNLDIDKKEEHEGIIEKGKEALKSLASFAFTGKTKGMEGLIQEGSEMVKEFANTEVADLSLAVAAQGIEHLEIVSYNTLCKIAEELGDQKILELLRDSLKEEKRAAQMLEEFSNKEIKSAVRSAKAATV